MLLEPSSVRVTRALAEGQDSTVDVEVVLAGGLSTERPSILTSLVFGAIAKAMKQTLRVQNLLIER